MILLFAFVVFNPSLDEITNPPVGEDTEFTVSTCDVTVKVWFTVSPIVKSLYIPASLFILDKFNTTSLLSNLAILGLYTDTNGSKL